MLSQPVRHRTHKLSPRTVACVFLGYPLSHKGYHCLDPTTRRIIVSWHIIFDEAMFPFSQAADRPADAAPALDFLLELATTQPPAMHAPRQPVMHGTRIPTPPASPPARSAPSSPGPSSPAPPSDTMPTSPTPDAASPSVLVHRPPSPSNRHGMVTRAK
jgi:histone deacetylase 1/2